MNPVIKATAGLVRAVRRADSQTLHEAITQLQAFYEKWLVSGEGEDLEGAGTCCLADTDTTEAVKSALEVWAEVKK